MKDAFPGLPSWNSSANVQFNSMMDNNATKTNKLFTALFRSFDKVPGAILTISRHLQPAALGRLFLII